MFAFLILCFTRCFPPPLQAWPGRALPRQPPYASAEQRYEVEDMRDRLAEARGAFEEAAAAGRGALQWRE